jgi:hypothetical protein
MASIVGRAPPPGKQNPLFQLSLSKAIGDHRPAVAFLRLLTDFPTGFSDKRELVIRVYLRMQ